MSSCCGNRDPKALGKTSPLPLEQDDEHPIWKLGLGLLLTGNTMVLGLAISSSEAASNIKLFIHIVLLGSVVLVWELLAGPMWATAWQGLRRRKITFELFFVIGALAAVAASLISMAGLRASPMTGTSGPVFFEVAAVLVVIYAVGRKVGAFRRRKGLEAARAWAPQHRTARVRGADGEAREAPLEAVAAGDIVIVGPGAMIPVDGIIVVGEALVREAELTGESFAVARRPGDRVSAGTHSLDGHLEIKTTAGAGRRRIDAIVDAVESAWQRPSRWQERAEAAITWFVPVVLLVTSLTFVVWTLLADWTVGLFNALAVLLIACPCALGFAIPLATWATMGKWASRGLIPRHGQAVETLSRVDTVIFDKTGTLTELAPRLCDFVIVESPSVAPSLLKEMVVAVEDSIDHPLARAMRRLEEELPRRCCRKHPAVETLKILPGKGVLATLRVDERAHTLCIGSTDLLTAAQAPCHKDLLGRARKVIGSREVVVLLNGELVAIGVIDESLRAHVDEALAELRAMGIETGLMTGDSAHRTAKISTDWTKAQMTPDEKHQAIVELQAVGKTTLFIGDGVNDAAAMAQSDVAIAVDGGADLASEVGDLIWGGRDLRILARAIQTARDAFTTTRFNLRFAVFYNVIGIAIAAAGLLHPVVAAILMMTSSLFVTWKTTIAVESAARRVGFSCGHDVSTSPDIPQQNVPDLAPSPLSLSPSQRASDARWS